MIEPSIKTLTEAVQLQSRKDPDRLALIFYDEDGGVVQITSAQFDQKASCYAFALQSLGVRADDLVILVLRHSLDLLCGFWGAMYLGAIASIFPYLTEKLDPQIYRQRVKELVIHSQANVVITYPEFKLDLETLLVESSARVLSTADVSADLKKNIETRDWPRFSEEKIAFLQHSSGTTGLQKGVALSHRAVLNQIRAYSQAIALNPADILVSWLPLYHDMGLIAGFVLPLAAGVPLVLMSPFKWVRDPKVLLQAVSRHHGTLCWLPNFAYNHSARVIRPRDLVGVNLSSMRAFINCSEPVFLQSQRIFFEKFSQFGLQEDMLSACYAMAENTFAVTQTPLGAPAGCDWVSLQSIQLQRLAVPAPSEAEGSTSLMSCGFPIEGTEIKIVDEKGNMLPDRHVGEVVLRSSCMLSHYYRRADLSREAIRDGWYFTGDMGYLVKNELFITGRKKDLIIVGGKNIYPQDLEAIANEIEGVVPGRSAAFGLFDPGVGSENIVMVCELENPKLSNSAIKVLELELRRRVVQRTEVAISDLRFVDRHWLIKTSSGKISRSAIREKYLMEFFSNQSTEGE